jgi:hypothetical protein
MLKIIFVRDTQGGITVLTNENSVKVLVLDAAELDAGPSIEVQGQRISLTSLLEGIPRCDPEQVDSLFAEVRQSLASAPVAPLRTQLANVQLSNFKQNVLGISPSDFSEPGNDV